MFRLIYGLFLVVSTFSIISIVFDSDIGQYLSILSMIGLTTSYAILAVFDCMRNPNILFGPLRGIVRFSEKKKDSLQRHNDTQASQDTV